MANKQLLWISGAVRNPEDQIILGTLAGFTVELAENLAEALERLAAAQFDAVLAHFPIPGYAPEHLLDEVRQNDPLVPVVVWNPEATIAEATRLIKLGAHQVFESVASGEELVEHLETAISDRQLLESPPRSCTADEPWRQFLVGQSPAIQDVAEVVRLVASKRCTVLITGETGTGKEIAARVLHMAGPRAHLPLIAVNCTAVPEHLLESELFGYVRGAFTGAAQNRIGRFEQAHRSTLFLDEIGDMPLNLQSKLLRVLQERELQRLGSSETFRLDVRVIAATNANLREKVKQGQFREDLYYRLNVFPLEMPPLRERASDIPMLVRHFIEKICGLEGIPRKEIRPEALKRLCGYSWPGNVRQLENAVEMAIAISGDRPTLLAGDFRLPAANMQNVVPIRKRPGNYVVEEGMDFGRAVTHFERDMLVQALQKTGGNKTLAAEMLGLKRTTLLAKLRNLAFDANSLSMGMA